MFDISLAQQAGISFLIGSIPFAVVAMWGAGTSIRDVGSGNPGFNNVLRFDKRRALFALIGDLAKGFAPIWLFYEPLRDPINTAWLLGMAAVFGHCYSPWLKLRGGKGIATSAGAMLAMYPGVAAVALSFFVPVRVLGGRLKIPEIGAWASLLTWAFFTVVIGFWAGMPHTKYAALMTVFLAWQHRSNIKRILGRAPRA
ncbi:MAG: glycerol-3-phosphate acyltransferase [Bryobacterales bacterium]|nr:glycerol-3-phosphate acyltransferase [Bryobacterales bacterium]